MGMRTDHKSEQEENFGTGSEDPAEQDDYPTQCALHRHPDQRPEQRGHPERPRQEPGRADKESVPGAALCQNNGGGDETHRRRLAIRVFLTRTAGALSQHVAPCEEEQRGLHQVPIPLLVPVPHAVVLGLDRHLDAAIGTAR